jgi:filamentous hemagglutinin family protein
MNHTYRLVWNDGCRACIPVGENARTRGKPSSKASTPPGARRLGAIAVAGALLALPLVAQAKSAADVAANALPTGFQVLRGSGSAATSGNVLDVTQNGQRAVFGWNSFDVGTAATVNFKQQAGAVGLNIIGGTDPSFILGKLNADSNVFFVNPNGMFFGNGASVNVGGMLATTMSMDPDAFMSGNYRLTNPGTGVIRNEGIIKATGSVALVGNTVQNAGSIYATTVTLAAGNAVAVDLTGDGLIRARVEDPVLLASIENSGTIEAMAVALTAGQARSMLDRVVNNSGIIRATGLLAQGGEIVLEGGSVTNSGTLAVGSGGSITASADKTLTIAAGSSLTADDGKITLTAVEVANVEKGALIQADRGNIKLWSDHASFANGTFRARNGFIETSGKYLDTEGITIDAKGGKWLLDPTDIVVWNTGVDNGITATGTNPITYTGQASGFSYIRDTTIKAALNSGTDVILDSTTTGTGGGTITVCQFCVITGSNATLTLNAYSQISIQGTITGTNLNVNLNSDLSGTTHNGVTVSGSINTGGGSFAAVGSQFQAVGGGTAVNTAGGNLSITANYASGGGISLGSGLISNGGHITLNSASSTSGMQLNHVIDAGAGYITLNLSNGGTATDNSTASRIVTSGLELLGNNATYQLGGGSSSTGRSIYAPGAVVGNTAQSGNPVLTVAGNLTGNSSVYLTVGKSNVALAAGYGMNTDLSVGTVGGTSGLTATNVSLTTTNGNILQTKPIIANALNALAYNGMVAGNVVNLTNANNQVTNLGTGGSGSGAWCSASSCGIGPSATPTFQFTNATALTVDGMVDAGAGGIVIKTLTGNLSIGNYGSLWTSADGTASAYANAITLVAGANTPANFSFGSMYTPAFHLYGTHSRYLIYSANANNITLGNLSRTYSSAGTNNGGYTNYFGSPYYNTNFDGSNLPAAPTSGTAPNALIFLAQPTLTVNANAASRQYGNANPAFTYGATGFVLGDTAAGTMSGALTSAANGTSSVGNYAITLGTLAANGYLINFTGANLSVMQRPISIAADAQTKAVGSPDPTLTYQVTSGSLVNGDTFSLSRAAGETIAGSPYAISLASGNPNYNISYTGNALTITAAPPAPPPPAPAPAPSATGGSTGRPDTSAAVGAASRSVQSAGSGPFGVNGAPPVIPPNGGWNRIEPPPVQPGPPKGRMLVCRNGA